MFGDSRLVADHFGLNLKKQRRCAGLSQEDLAVRASLHRTEIGLLENGHRLPRLDTLIKIAGALEMDAGVLLEGLEWTSGSNIEGAFSAPPMPEAAPHHRGRSGTTEKVSGGGSM